MAGPLSVRFVATDGPVWTGEATSVLVRTTEGDIGILPGHEPFMAALVPHAAEVVGTDGVRQIIAIDSGFISVVDNRVSVLSAFGELASRISVDEARIAHAALNARVQAAEVSEAELRSYRRYVAQVRAAEKQEQIALPGARS